MVDDSDCCPLCMEDMDVTDKNFRPCKCGYQICLFCYNKIKDNHNGACPACRTPYDEANAVFVTPDPSECALNKATPGLSCTLSNTSHESYRSPFSVEPARHPTTFH